VANIEMKHPKNLAGRFYCTDPDDDNGEGCIACNVCYNGAPDFFAEDEDGTAYVIKQPTTPDEVELCTEQLEACPVCSIGDTEQ
jgi:ferredoxin